jgi:hypothetical protein
LVGPTGCECGGSTAGGHVPQHAVVARAEADVEETIAVKPVRLKMSSPSPLSMMICFSVTRQGRNVCESSPSALLPD